MRKEKRMDLGYSRGQNQQDFNDRLYMEFEQEINKRCPDFAWRWGAKTVTQVCRGDF